LVFTIPEREGRPTFSRSTQRANQADQTTTTLSREGDDVEPLLLYLVQHAG